MGAFGEQLGESLFVRVHRSALVRRDNIVRIGSRPTGGLQVELGSGQTVPVGRRYEAAVRAMAAARMRPPQAG